MTCCCRGGAWIRWCALAAGVAAIVGAVLLQAGAREPQDAPPEAVSLHDHMEGVNREFRQVLRSVADPAKRDDTLKSLDAVQSHVLAAKSMNPPGLDTLPDAERPARVLAFRKSLSELLGALTKLEVDIIDGRTEDASNRIRDEIVKMRNEAHEQFQVED